jgi:hypothetical protein
MAVTEPVFSSLGALSCFAYHREMLTEALRQIGENRYTIKLTEAEAGVIRGYGVVC